MLLKNALDLKRSIEESRKDMCKMARMKGINNPEVVKISQDLDEKINLMQKVLYDIQIKCTSV